MERATCITTSWDDGHPLDLRVAELLTKYGLTGTFYVPRWVEYGVMSEAQVRDLSGAFEIGAHTLNHVVLTEAPDELARREIIDSRSWAQDVTGAPCPMFCPPRGKFAPGHLRMIRKAGYRGVRTVELLSLDRPRAGDGLAVMPTTLQVYPHSPLGYAKNLLRRGLVANLWTLLRFGRSDWTRLSRSLLGRALERGGVFHLWGHSWELEHTGQWQRLEEVLRFLSQFTSQARPLTNGQICQVAPVAPVEALR